MMLKGVMILGAGVLCSTVVLATPPVNLPQAKKSLEVYHDSGAYQRDLSATYKKATAYLQQRIQSNQKAAEKKKLAVVMDIDETALSNYPALLKENFGGTDHQIDAAIMKGDDPVIKPALRFFNFAKSHHVAVFFVTGRKEFMRSETVKNLKAVGYSGWQKLYLEPNSYDKHSAIPYKSAIRKQIEQQGYDIALTIGDQWSDLKGGYADHGDKLVDPFYFIA